MNLVIINSGVGNVRSVANMLKRFHVEAQISNDPRAIAQADSIILPGVGSFDAAVRRFRAAGVKDVLDEKVAEKATPILGICLGMQLMGDRSEEGAEPGFGWVPGELKRFRPADGGAQPIRVPHMGWNLVRHSGREELYKGFDQTPRFYFDHSYYFIARDPAHYSGLTQYGVEFAAGIRNGLLFGVQFHPEKSHRFGLQLLRNFVAFAKGHVEKAMAPADV